MRGKLSIAVLFGTVVLLPLLLSAAVQGFQAYLKHRAEERIESEALVTISVPVADVQWMEEGREVMIKGRMFDLESYKEEAGTFTATGVYDDAETEAMEWLRHFNDREQSALVIQLLLLSQTFAALLFLLPSLARSKTRLRHTAGITPQLSASFHPDVFYPPRKFFVGYN